MITTALLLLAAIASPDTTLRLPRGGTVEIEAGFRNVSITVGSDDRVTVSGASAEREGNRVTIEAMGFMVRRGSGPLRLTVPSWATVEVTVINGHLDVERAPESLTAEVINGNLSTRGGTGVMLLSTATGSITVREFAGTQLDVESLTGPVTIEGATGRVRVEAVNDPVFLRNVRSLAVDAASVNGRIEWSGDFGAGGRYRFESHNGAVELRLPANVSARLHVTTFMGGFASAIAATTNGRGRRTEPPVEGGREFTAVYGSGAAEVWIETFHGGIRVRPMTEI